MALWNSPFASGDAWSTQTDHEPADWPKMVTLPGSPPNAATLSRTHSRVAMWSRMP